MNSYQVFHSPCEFLRKRLQIVLVRPKLDANIGAAARAAENMGLYGDFCIVGKPSLGPDAFRLAKHAKARLETAHHFAFLEQALPKDGLSLATTARVGSSQRPHPAWIDAAAPRAVEQLKSGACKSISLVFGSESDGLSNEETALCNWIVTIPSVEKYRSINLAQAVLLVGYEFNRCLMERPAKFETEKPSQREKLVDHFLQMAESTGFILPGDPHKMRPRLSQILSQLPPHVEGTKTLHGLLDQVVRSVKKGEIDYKGRYKQWVEKSSGAGVETPSEPTYNRRT